MSCWYKLGSCIWPIRVYIGDFFFFFTAAVDVMGGDVFWPCCCRDGYFGRLLGLMFNSAVSDKTSVQFDIKSSMTLILAQPPKASSTVHFNGN